MKKTLTNFLFWSGMVLMFTTMFMGACSHERKVQKAITTLKSDPLAAAKFCADEYPVIPEYIKGKDTTILDTVEVITEVPVASVPDTLTKDTIIYITRTKYINRLRVDTVKKPDSALAKKFELMYLKERDEKLEAKEAKNKSDENAIYWKGKARERWWIIFFLIGTAVGLTIFKLYKKIRP